MAHMQHWATKMSSEFNILAQNKKAVFKEICIDMAVWKTKSATHLAVYNILCGDPAGCELVYSM